MELKDIKGRRLVGKWVTVWIGRGEYGGYRRDGKLSKIEGNVIILTDRYVHSVKYDKFKHLYDGYKNKKGISIMNIKDITMIDEEPRPKKLVRD